MTIDRRDFLAIGSGLLAQAACKGSAIDHGAEGPRPVPAPAGAGSWQAVRDLFDLDWSYTHLGGMLLVSHPRPVRQAIEQHRRELDRNPVAYLHGRGEELDLAARKAAADYLGADPLEVAMTDSTTMGLGLLYGGFRLRPGQEMLTTEHEHYAADEALRFRALRDGATLRRVALFEQSGRATQEEIVGRLTREITPRTRLVAITWVLSSNGLKVPVRAIADAIATLNRGRDEQDRVLLAVDGVHGFGIEDVQMSDLGCDFFAAGCHKWLFGPRGTGVLWGRRSQWHNVMRTIPAFAKEAAGPWMMGTPEAASDLTAVHMTPGGYHSFEHRWALPAAFELHRQIGRGRVMGRIHALNRQLKEGLVAMKGVTLHTPMSEALSSGLTCFEVAGVKPKDVVERLLAKRIIGTTSPYRVSYVRLSPGLLNTPEEVDATLRVIRGLT